MTDRLTSPVRLLALLLVLLAGTAGTAAAQVFYPDDPLWTDPDRLDVPKPAPSDVSDFHHYVVSTFGSPAEHDGPAANVNTLGEVPNSSWYTNRHYRHPMTLEELRRGPDTVEGPSREAPWKVLEGKSEGKSAGMLIEDARGDRYLLKFDPKGYAGLTSGAEVISTKIFHALGYHVPENFAVTFSTDDFVVAEDATLETGGSEVPLTRADVLRVLGEKAAEMPGGGYRALASKYLSGEPLGPFLYHGTRPDDANDIIPHELRRELRGLRVAAAWLNHTDARAINSLDMFVEQDGRRYVRHHLIDFGSTMGAGPLGPKDRWDGKEYSIDLGPIAARALTFGLGASDWFDRPYPEYPSVGRFSAEGFSPRAWKPQYPNPAFRRMDAADAFWMAKQVANFDDEEIRAIVETAGYPDPGAAEYVAETLIARRDAIARAYLSFGGGLDRFRVEDGRLHFEDLAARHGLAAADRARHVVWRPFDNATGETGPTLVAGEAAGTAIDVPRTEAGFVSADIRTPGQGATRVTLRRDAGAWTVVGVERE